MKAHRKMAAKMLFQLRVFLKIFVASNHWTAYLDIVNWLLKALIASE